MITPSHNKTWERIRMNKQKLGMPLCVAAILALAIGTIGAADAPQQVPVSDLGPKFVLVGELSQPLGTFMTIEGTPHQGPAKMSNPFDVDTINGIKLAKPVLVELQSSKNLPQNARSALRGYETGGMNSSPVDPLHKDGPGPQQPYHFATWFVVTDVQQPAMK
jgi:hypothetical protein